MLIFFAIPLVLAPKATSDSENQDGNNFQRPIYCLGEDTFLSGHIASVVLAVMALALSVKIAGFTKRLAANAEEIVVHTSPVRAAAAARLHLE